MYSSIQRCLGASAKGMLIAELCIYSGIAILVLCGFLESLPMEVVMAPAALTIGSIQGYARSIYSSLIPPGKESSMFAFYEITDKGSNLIGAAVTVVVHTTFHSYLPTFWYILLGFSSSIVILCFVDVEAGLREIGKDPGLIQK